jgi:hypothetical protein
VRRVGVRRKVGRGIAGTGPGQGIDGPGRGTDTGIGGGTGRGVATGPAGGTGLGVGRRGGGVRLPKGGRG